MNRIAQIIALVNQKGGPGKTTLTMHLAGSLARRGAKILISRCRPPGNRDPVGRHSSR